MNGSVGAYTDIRDAIGKKYAIENSRVFFVDSVEVQIERLAPWLE